MISLHTLQVKAGDPAGPPAAPKAETGLGGAPLPPCRPDDWLPEPPNTTGIAPTGVVVGCMSLVLWGTVLPAVSLVPYMPNSCGPNVVAAPAGAINSRDGMVMGLSPSPASIRAALGSTVKGHVP